MHFVILPAKWFSLWWQQQSVRRLNIPFQKDIQPEEISNDRSTQFHLRLWTRAKKNTFIQKKNNRNYSIIILEALRWYQWELASPIFPESKINDGNLEEPTLEEPTLEEPIQYKHLDFSTYWKFFCLQNSLLRNWNHLEKYFSC